MDVRKIAVVLFFGFSCFFAGWAVSSYKINLPKNGVSKVKFVPKPKPLEKYSIENLTNYIFPKGKLKIERKILAEEDYISYLFSHEFNPSIDRGSESKKVTGVINIPNETGTFPVILMLRGYVDQKIYTSGMGTRKAVEFFAKHGFITVAPDFLGYGESDKEAENIFESRFQTYATALSILSSIESISQWDGKNIFIWGHSNGGQIALTLLEVSKDQYPTVLWAPVSKPFPYSVLYYTDESEDKGKLIRRELAKFEEDYDVEKYSLVNYLDKINAPLQIHQGTADDAVSIDWTKELCKHLDNIKPDCFYYPGTDHNLSPSWNLVVQRNLDFFAKNLKI